MFRVAVLLGLVFATSGYSRVYKNIEVGTYPEEAYLHLDDCKGRTFLQCMKDEVYPAIAGQADNMYRGKHIDGVKAGSGVELRLTEYVSTYHVKYKKPGKMWDRKLKKMVPNKAERSGRSFSAVSKNQKVIRYVADASYSHYLRTMEKMYTDTPGELKKFYTAILKVVANSDASGFKKLKWHTKEVAADFVAVLVAEQYRHLLGGKGKYLGKKHNWDDALFQVTLAAAFHAGQDERMAMFYEGDFTDMIMNQNYRETIRVKVFDDELGKYVWEEQEVTYCFYNKKKHPERHRFEDKTRAATLRDYWQFGRSNDCRRSGVNVTRRDFEKLGRTVTGILSEEWDLEGLQEMIRLETDIDALREKYKNRSKKSRDKAIRRAKYQQWARDNNIVKAISYFFISNESPSLTNDEAEEYVAEIVDFLMIVRDEAEEITHDLLG